MVDSVFAEVCSPSLGNDIRVQMNDDQTLLAGVKEMLEPVSVDMPISEVSRMYAMLKMTEAVS